MGTSFRPSKPKQYWSLIKIIYVLNMPWLFLMLKLGQVIFQKILHVAKSTRRIRHTVASLHLTLKIARIFFCSTLSIPWSSQFSLSFTLEKLLDCHNRFCQWTIVQGYFFSQQMEAVVCFLAAQGIEITTMHEEKFKQTYNTVKMPRTYLKFHCPFPILLNTGTQKRANT